MPYFNMKSFLLHSGVLATFIASVSTSAIPRQTASECCFELFSPELNGTVEEDTIGENRLLGAYPDGNYCVSASFNGLHDLAGHTCLVSPTSQRFECYGTGIVSNTTFSVADNGNLLHDGCQNWLACPSTGQVPDGSYFLFSDKATKSTGCVIVTLRTSGNSCSALGRPSSSSNSSVATSTSGTTQSIPSQTNPSITVAPFSTSILSSTISTTTKSSNLSTGLSTAAAAAVATPGACSKDISSEYLVPHIIVPISSKSPNTSYGKVYSPIINTTESTLYAFDVPSSSEYSGQCSLLFLFPYGNQAVYQYTFTGTEEELGENGGLDFKRLGGLITKSTSYASAPPVSVDFGKTAIIPGNNYTISTFACPAGQQLVIEASSLGNVGLTYFQDDQPRAIGVYVVPCF